MFEFEGTTNDQTSIWIYEGGNDCDWRKDFAVFGLYFAQMEFAYYGS